MCEFDVAFIPESCKKEVDELFTYFTHEFFDTWKIY